MKSYGINCKLKPVKEPIPWWSYALNNGGSPVVIRRKLKYAEGRLNTLAGWEKTYKEEAAKSPLQRHPNALANLRRRVEHAKDRAHHSILILRNCIRFSLARIDPDSPDRDEMVKRRAEFVREQYPRLTKPEALLAEVYFFDNKKPKALAKALGLEHKEMLGQLTALRKKIGMDPIISATGVTNRKFHKELHYYARVIDDYLLAKKAAAGGESANDAMKKLQVSCERTIAHFRNRSGREQDDSDQQAALGILDACKAYEPGKDGKMAKFTTFAAWKIRRKTQTRKSSHCRPGQIMVGGKTKTVGHIDMSVGEEGRGDQFHPVDTSVNPAVRLDVKMALSALSEEDRDIAARHLMNGQALSYIARELGTTNGKIRARMERIKATLAHKLRHHSE